MATTVCRRTPIILSIQELRALNIPRDCDMGTHTIAAEDLLESDSDCDDGVARSVFLSCSVCYSPGKGLYVPMDVTSAGSLRRGPRILPARDHLRARGTTLANETIVGAACGDITHATCVLCVRRGRVAFPTATPACHAVGGPAHDGTACGCTFEADDLAALFPPDECFAIEAAQAIPAVCAQCLGPGLATGALRQSSGAGGMVACRDPSCGAQTCFTCGEPSVHDGICLVDVGAWVPYLPGANTGPGQPRAPYMRRFEVGGSVLAASLRAVRSDDGGRIACFRCEVVLAKTTDCNSVAHCDMEHCWACGMASLPGRPLPPTHWDTCPRYDDDVRWHDVGVRDYRCRGGVCHDDERDCHREDHRVGREGLLAARRNLRRKRMTAAAAGTRPPALHECRP